MSQQSGFVKAGDFKLHYLKMGSGPKLLIAFHGYGNDAALFNPFEKYLHREYTIYSVDLPHHGRSESDNIPMEKKDIIELVNNLAVEMKVEKVSLMGYSIGGRVCITIAEMIPQQIDKMLLLASDGLAFNPFYYFLTNTYIGRKVFTDVLTRPKKYILLIDWLKNRKLIPSHRHRFASWYLQTESTRAFLLKVWPGLKKLVPNPRKTRAAISQNNIPVYIFMGAQDDVIPVKLAHSFKRNLKSVHLTVLDKGHRVMDNDTLPQISACLL